jgi:hypothetical protein
MADTTKGNEDDSKESSISERTMGPQIPRYVMTQSQYVSELIQEGFGYTDGSSLLDISTSKSTPF